MEPFIAIVLSVSAFFAAAPPVIFALATRAPRLAMAVGAVGIAAPVLFLFWVPTRVEGDYYAQLGAFLSGMPILIGVTCVILSAIVWAAWWLKRRRAQNDSSDD